jgi:TetR/AcrR family transcriptional regulator, transcriptional repressor for nem operon
LHDWQGKQMRYSKAHKEATHARLVETAAQQFRARGGGLSIADLMDELQLTHGGFYRHFASKDELYAEALTFSFAQKITRVKAIVQNAGQGSPLPAVIAWYLSLDHCRNRADGCPVAALSGEIVRQSPLVRQAFDDGLATYIEQLAPLLPGTTVEEQKQSALALFSGMVGALSVARAAADETLQASILAAARALYTRVYGAAG